MCCRYWFVTTPELWPAIEEMNRSSLAEAFRRRGRIVTEGEVRPSDVSPVVAMNRRGERKVFPMKWGFRAKTLLINARAETAGEKPLFREAWQAHRCAVPAAWYYEWEHLTDSNGKTRTGDRYRIGPAGGETAWLCGLYRLEEGLPCYVVLTREPGENLRFIHNRMPLILPESAVGDWIRPDAHPEELLRLARTELAAERA